MEENRREATVVAGKCANAGKTFGIRMEKTDGVWHCTWAFKISDTAARNEGYDSERVSGKIDVNEEYPGCPYCGTKGWFSCGKCGKLTCFSGEEIVTCGWCGNSGKTVSSDTFDLKGGGY